MIGYAVSIIKESSSNKETKTITRVEIDWKETAEDILLLKCALCRMCCVQKVIRDSLKRIKR